MPPAAANPIPAQTPDQVETELLPVAAPALEAQVRGEIDVQIATARRFPRSIQKFMQNAESLATMNAEVAAACFYKLPRAGKNIEGPSVRLAEIVAATYGHMRIEARPMREDERYVTSQGAAWDIENNVAIRFEVRRRIVDKQGKRFNDDMINQTQNVASSIALRNAVFRVVPKAFWDPIYEKCKKVAVGDAKTLADRRAKMLDFFQKLGVPQQRLFDTLKVNGVEDITLEHLETLLGIANAVREGDVTIDDAFPLAATEATPEQTTERATALDRLKDTLRNRGGKPETATVGPDTVNTTTGEVLTRDENNAIDQQLASEDAARPPTDEPSVLFSGPAFEDSPAVPKPRGKR